MILKWREYTPEATEVCKEQFGYLLAENGLTELDPADTFTRICHRYCGYAKTIHIKRPEYFTSRWAMDGVANQFSGIGVKWFIPLFEKRIKKENRAILTPEVAEELIRWATTRYNFWLSSQIYA
jgi:hypothetical protein